jgi:formamidopyrimidine-DNA glycosylase
MPELPEVQTVVTTLAPRVSGKRIRRVVHLRQDMVTPTGFDLAAAVTGRPIRHIARRGKRIVFHLGETLRRAGPSPGRYRPEDRPAPQRFFIHLGMTGRLTVEPAGAPREPHTHLIFDLGNGQELRFRDPRRFGEIRWLGCDDCDEHMGPEPLVMRTSQLANKLSGTTRAIKNALMDQAVVAGLGNIYVDESLHDARIHPLSRADALDEEQVARLTKSIKKVLRRAIRHRGSTLRDYVDADGAAGGFQHLHRVYDREGLRCRSCKSPIKRIVLGGRSTHFCPKCQPQAASNRNATAEARGGGS